MAKINMGPICAVEEPRDTGPPERFGRVKEFQGFARERRGQRVGRGVREQSERSHTWSRRAAGPVWRSRELSKQSWESANSRAGQTMCWAGKPRVAMVTGPNAAVALSRLFLGYF